MKTRFRLMSRGARGGAFYCVDSLSGKRTSLGKVDRDAAEQIVLARNQALRQPSLNLHIAKAYLAGSDSGVNTRTWADALSAIVESKQGTTRSRWAVAAKDKAFDGIRDAILIETRAETLLEAIRRGTVSTNVHLRKLHNYCLDMGWLPWPIIPKRQWPAIRYGEKRAIRFDEHFAIIDREPNPERGAFYELCWHLGGAQGDIASLAAEDIDWERRVIAYFRRKTESPALIRFGHDVERVLRQLPASGPLFPNLRGVRASDRATEFKQRCRGLGIEGVTLHSYRYSWAERAKTAGYPERFAQEALGHNSKAVHRAYARHAEVTLPALEDYERKATGRKVVPVRFAAAPDSAQVVPYSTHKSPARETSATRPASATHSNCASCTTVTTVRASDAAKGGEVLLARGKPTKLVSTHGCDGCSTSIGVTGFGKSKTQTVTHSCTKQMLASVSCCK